MRVQDYKGNEIKVGSVVIYGAPDTPKEIEDQTAKVIEIGEPDVYYNPITDTDDGGYGVKITIQFKDDVKETLDAMINTNESRGEYETSGEVYEVFEEGGDLLVIRTEPFEDDTRNPFMPGDDLPKPEQGDILVLRRLESTADMPGRLIVTRTHDNLGESWDPTGEDAWGQQDVNDVVGFKGHWYAYGLAENDDVDEHLVASYEVASIEKADQD